MSQEADIVRYKTWGEVLKDIVDSKATPPESHSNRAKWEKLGFKALNQTETKIGKEIGGCFIYSTIHAVQLSLLEQVETKSKVDHLALEKTLKSSHFSASSPKGVATPQDLGLEKLLLHGIPLKDGRRFKPNQITISDLGEWFWNYGSSFPSWLKDRMHVHTRGMTPQYELATAFRDMMMKHEISKGRPVVVSGQWPDDRAKRRWGPKIWITENTGEAVLRLVSHPSGLANGGHTTVAVGYKPDPLDPRKTLYECVNSWGPQWADGGYIWVSSDWYDFWNNTMNGANFVSLTID